MPVEGAIPHLSGIEMYGNSIPAGTVAGDLFEYIKFLHKFSAALWYRCPHPASRKTVERVS